MVRERGAAGAPRLQPIDLPARSDRFERAEIAPRIPLRAGIGLPQSIGESILSTSKPTVAVLATLNTKGKEARFVADSFARAGVTPWTVDLSLKAHNAGGADVAGASVPALAGASRQALSELSRQDAAVQM